MKKQLFAVAAAILISLMAAGASYAQQPVLAVDIPFEFQAGNQLMPPGHYHIENVALGVSTLQRLMRDDGSASTVLSTLTVESKHGTPEPMLVFHRYGQDFFLSQIWTGGNQGRKLYESNREKEIARADQYNEIALLFTPTTAKP